MLTTTGVPLTNDRNYDQQFYECEAFCSLVSWMFLHEHKYLLTGEPAWTAQRPVVKCKASIASAR